jgi:DNA-binding IclR family transcriptional regulator
MPRESVADVLKRELAEMRLQSAAADEIVEKVRREGVSRVRDTMMVGLSAVAAPVFDHDGRLLYVLTALGQTESFDTSLKGATAGIVRNKAMELSTRLGFKPESAKSISLSHERRRR